MASNKTPNVCEENNTSLFRMRLNNGQGRRDSPRSGGVGDHQNCARSEGIEPSLAVLETAVLPLNDDLKY